MLLRNPTAEWFVRIVGLLAPLRPELEPKLLGLLDHEGYRTLLLGEYPYFLSIRFTATRIPARTLSFCVQSMVAFFFTVTQLCHSALQGG